MTKSEGNRLGIVETKVDGMVRDIVILKDFLTEKIDVQGENIGKAMNAQEKNIGTAMTASEKAIVKAEIANDLRFSGMDKRITDSIDAINVSITTLTNAQNLSAGAKTGIKEFIGYILAAVTIVGFIIAQFIGRGV